MVVTDGCGKPRERSKKDGPQLHDQIHEETAQHRPVGVQPLPHGPRHRRGGAHLPHDNSEDEEAGGARPRRAHRAARDRGRDIGVGHHGARVHGHVPRLQGQVRHDRALHGEELPRGDQADLPLARQRQGLRANRRRRERLDGRDDRRGLRPEVGGQALPAAQAGAQVGHGAGAPRKERVRVLQAAQAREDAHKRALARGQEPYAGACSRGAARADGNCDRARAHDGHAARRGVRAALERPLRRRDHRRHARPRQRPGRLLPQGAQDRQLTCVNISDTKT